MARLGVAWIRDGVGSGSIWGSFGCQVGRRQRRIWGSIGSEAYRDSPGASRKPQTVPVAVTVEHHKENRSDTIIELRETKTRRPEIMRGGRERTLLPDSETSDALLFPARLIWTSFSTPGISPKPHRFLQSECQRARALCVLHERLYSYFDRLAGCYPMHACNPAFLSFSLDMNPMVSMS